MKTYVVEVSDRYIVTVDDDEMEEGVDIEEILQYKIDNGDCIWTKGSFDYD